MVTPDAPNIMQGAERWEGYQRIIEAKKPRYLVLRIHEWDWLSSRLEGTYRVVARFPSPYAGQDYTSYLIAERQATTGPEEKGKGH